LDGTDVTYEGVTIGTFSGGVNGIDLAITLNTNASPEAVKALIEHLTYANTSNTPAETRDITISLDRPSAIPQDAPLLVNFETSSVRQGPVIASISDEKFIVTWF